MRAPTPPPIRGQSVTHYYHHHHHTRLLIIAARACMCIINSRCKLVCLIDLHPPTSGIIQDFHGHLSVKLTCCRRIASIHLTSLRKPSIPSLLLSGELLADGDLSPAGSDTLPVTRHQHAISGPWNHTISASLRTTWKRQPCPMWCRRSGWTDGRTRLRTVLK
jgi:hypothetical protein